MIAPLDVTFKSLYEAYLAGPSAPPAVLDPQLVRDFFYDGAAAVFHLLTHNLKTHVITEERWTAIAREVALYGVTDVREPDVAGTLAWWCADGLRKIGLPPDLSQALEMVLYSGAHAAITVMTQKKFTIPTEAGFRSLAADLEAYLVERHAPR